VTTKTHRGFEAARGAVIEIVEKRPEGDYDSLGGDIIVPTEIRINGQALAASADHPVRVHEVSIKGGDAVLVTLTLFAKRVTFDHETGTPARTLPVALRIGHSASHEVGTVEDASAIPDLLRHVADEMEKAVDEALTDAASNATFDTPRQV
jgi:hypothetical protein